MMEAAGSTEVLANSYENLRRYFKVDIIYHSLYYENQTKIRTTLCGQHSELFVVLFKESYNFLSLPADSTMAASQDTQTQQPFLAVHSADEHHVIYYFSNSTSHFTFYALFTYFRITIWPTWVANSKRQPVLIHHSHTHKKTHRTDKPDGKLVLCQRTFRSVIRAVFYTVRLHSLTKLHGSFRVYGTL
jgi:hypothetical protein